LTAEQLISKLEQIYGEYNNDYLKAVVIGYLKKDIKPDQIENVYRAIVYHHKANFGVPCVATIEESIESAIKKKNTFSPYITKGVNSSVYDYKREAEQNPEEFMPVGSLLKDLAKKVNK
jgi:hypothetical protein